MIRYRCPTCKAEAEINKKKKEVKIYLPPLKLPKHFTPFKLPTGQCFPSHFDCQLALPIDQIDLTKLEKVEVKQK